VPARILDGRTLAAELRVGLETRSGALRAAGVASRLIVVVVGDDPSSAAYVRSIEKVAARVAVDVAVDALPADADDQAVRRHLAQRGADPAVHGIILQQPLPAGLSIRHIADALPAGKDVDGTNPLNQGRLAFGSGAEFVPATPAAVMLLLEQSEKWPLRGRDATVVGRSAVVGLPVSLLLIAQRATVTVANTATADLRAHVGRADVLVVAAGSPGLIPGSWLRPGVTVIDVGTTVRNGALVGDVDYASAAKVAGEITPVPGGVGPVTNVALLRNVVTAAERQSAHAGR
jgi:methylenetetrahydrofolate dehydrogenase (NADP+) / methenyltetrahydrofolate cyclohydrolase